MNNPPSATGDEPSYDSIAWQISRGHGFREDFDDPEFRAPYDAAAKTQPDLMTLPHVVPGTVTYRPPLFSLLIAVTNLLFGRQFWGIRLINISAMAAAGGLLWGCVSARHGRWAAAMVIILFVLADVRTRLYARAVLTESLAVLLTTILTVLLIRLSDRPRMRDVVFAGIVTGVGMLNRSAFVLWLPGLAVLMVWIVWPGKRPFQMTALFLTTAILVFSPWAIRNCLVLNRFMPTGTQGMTELSAGFSDEAWSRGGIWFNLDSIDFFQSVQQPGMSRIDQELARAEFSRSRAFAWVQSHPGRAVVLGLKKIFNEYRPHSIVEYGLTALACCGLWFGRRKRIVCILLLLNLINMSVIAATWSVDQGRFVVPLIVSIYLLAAEGVSGLRTVVGSKHETDQALPIC